MASMPHRAMIAEGAGTSLAQVAQLLLVFNSDKFSVLIQYRNRENKLNVKRVTRLSGITEKARIIVAAHAMMAVVATLAAGFALLLWVFVRHALRNARQDAESAQKLGLLASALRRSVGRRA
jgi:hypothetical protein